MRASTDFDADWLLHRGVAEIITETELRKLLAEGRPLRLKQGFDPSRPDLHLGHAVGLRKLRQFQELGHHLILIVGDWTAQIGDPSGQSATRPMLTPEEVNENAESYLRQFFKVVDPDRTQVVRQSEWYGNGKFDLADVIQLTSKFTVAQMLAREDFAKRFAEHRPITITELLYPLLQAYDSVAIKADVEFGGIDQKFNILVGRELQGMVGQRPQQAFLMPILVGTDGVQKMSKSLGNYVALDEPPAEMYGKLMRIPDELIINYFELLTDVPNQELEEMRQELERQTVNPMTLKKRLAREIVTEFHDAEAAGEAEQHFERVFQQREVPEELPIVGLPPAWFGLPVSPIDLQVTAGLASSRSEAKRSLEGEAVRLNGEKLINEPVIIQPGAVLRVGRRKFVRLVPADE